jgi:hypothetical protein
MSEITLTLNEAQIKGVNVLIAAASVAQKAGVFSLQDAKVVFEAIQAFATESEEKDSSEES